MDHRLPPDGPALWNRVLDRLRNSTPDYAYQNWFSQVSQVSTDEAKVTLAVPNLFVRDWILDHYGDVLRKAIHSFAERPLDISFVIDPQGGGDAPARPQVEPLGPDGVQINVLETSDERPKSKLREQFTFDNFVVGASNQLAAAAALAVADNPGKVYNPLFIYGGTGLGKTHLLHAVGNRIQQRNPASRIVYTSAESYLNEFLHLLRRGRMDEFRQKFRENVDVLMIDDIQVLKKAQETQNEFFFTFNDLHDAGKAIILTSDIHPNELQNIDARLRSRFSSGLTADVFEPPFEVRVAILKRKAELERLTLTDEVAHFVAGAFSKNVRELEGALTKIAAHASLTRRPLTLPYAEEILRDCLPPKQALSLEHIQKVVARFYNYDVSELLGQKRTRPIARARAVAMYFCRKLVAGASYPVIGQRFGNKHHTTVMSAVDNIGTEREKDAAFSRQLEELERQILA